MNPSSGGVGVELCKAAFHLHMACVCIVFQADMSNMGGERRSFDNVFDDTLSSFRSSYFLESDDLCANFMSIYRL
jgi:hypothetical protein